MGRRSLGSEEVDGGPAGSSGRLAARPAVEVVPDGGAGAVLVLVGLGHEGHGQVHVAALRRRLDQLVHPGEGEGDQERHGSQGGLGNQGETGPCRDGISRKQGDLNTIAERQRCRVGPTPQFHKSVMDP